MPSIAFVQNAIALLNSYSSLNIVLKVTQQSPTEGRSHEINY
ncbi:MAG: hypothetical protein ACHBN1_22820 [Heteroscytonema crispum UTEX LB 1556]